VDPAGGGTAIQWNAAPIAQVAPLAVAQAAPIALAYSPPFSAPLSDLGQAEHDRLKRQQKERERAIAAAVDLEQVERQQVEREQAERERAIASAVAKAVDLEQLERQQVERQQAERERAIKSAVAKAVELASSASDPEPEAQERERAIASAVANAVDHASAVSTLTSTDADIRHETNYDQSLGTAVGGQLVGGQLRDGLLREAQLETKSATQFHVGFAPTVREAAEDIAVGHDASCSPLSPTASASHASAPPNKLQGRLLEALQRGVLPQSITELQLMHAEVSALQKALYQRLVERVQTAPAVDLEAALRQQLLMKLAAQQP